jgi:RND superfamily putative drug exporter
MHPAKAIGAWLVMAIAAGALAVSAGGTYSNSFDLPDTESTTAQELLGKIPVSGESFNVATAKIVWKSETANAVDPSVSAPISKMLTKIAAIPSVDCVIPPSQYGPAIGTKCPAPMPALTPEQQAAQAEQYANLPPKTLKVMAGLASSGFSLDTKIAYATVNFSGDVTNVSTADAKALLDAVKETAASNDLVIGANGQALEFAGQEPPSSEAIGVTVALIILLFTFGSLIGAFLPIISAILSLAVGQSLMLVVANYMDVATFAPTLAAMIGLGVGIDYSLFVMNRYKQDLDAGTEPKEAALEAAKSAGRAVFFAALTVIIGLLGLFVMGIGFFNGLAIAAAVTVVMMMIGATVLLPAVLSLLGKRAFALRMPWARKPKPYDPDNRLFARYALWLETHFKWFGAVALVVLIAIASPVASLRLGFSDDSGKAATNPARVAYDLVSEGFGAGLNGPFIVAIETKTAGDQMAVVELATAVSQDAGVAAAIPLPMDPASTYGAMSVIPDSSPQDEATTDLLNRLRDEVIPSVTNSGKLDAYVGGTQAITSDFTQVLVDALPLFLTVVIGLGFVTLIFLFRSILVPLTGALTSLLSLSAAMGVTVAVFQWGWFAELVGLQATGPIQPFLPIMVFAILFGLSMDYQVFLVSAMQEKWNETGDNEQAVRRGMGISGRVVAIAASIMFSVFAAFILGNDPTIKLFGIALSTAVLFDAFIVRLIIVPSLMFTFNKANWWLPNFLKKLLPNVSAH